MIVNLTPHDVIVVDENGNTIKVFPKSKTPTRCSVSREVIGKVGGYPLYKSVFGAVENLPTPKKGRFYIVSRLVAEAVKRNDLLIPDDTVRDNEGRIIGCRGFSRL